MDEVKQQEMSEPGFREEPMEEELSHTDKIAGIFTEPSATFEKIAKFPPKTIDWILPVIFMIVFALVSSFAIQSNPVIMSKQKAEMQKQNDEAVQQGKMTQEQADRAMEMMEGGARGVFMVIQMVSTTFFLFILFFIVSGIYYLVSRYALKGEGTYSAAMVSNALPYYIGLISIIIMTIASMLIDRVVAGTSIAAFAGMDKSTFLGFLMGKIDILTFWALAVTGIGLAKMFHSRDTKKYIIAMFVIYFVWGFIAFGLAKAVPALRFLNM